MISCEEHEGLFGSAICALITKLGASFRSFLVFRMIRSATWKEKDLRMGLGYHPALAEASWQEMDLH